MPAVSGGAAFTAPPPVTSVVPIAPTPSVDAGPLIDAHESSLAEYLNKPVSDILARFGIAPPPAATPVPNPSDHGPQNGPVDPGPAAGSSGAPSAPFDPTQLIQPVTDALSMLGSGQFGDLDPTKILGNISQTLESAGQSVQQAMSSLTGSWQGDAAASATAATDDALATGANVSTQADDLRASLTAATASVQQAQTRLLEIIDQYFATLAAIGPNIIFPWGMAAAVQAATQAVNMSVEVITETQAALIEQAGQTAQTGQPVAGLAVAPKAAMMTGATEATAATPDLAQSFSPLVQMATGLSSPVMEGVSAATQAIPHGPQTPLPGDPANGSSPPGDPRVTPGGRLAGGGGGGGTAITPRIGNPGTPVQPSVPASTKTTEASATIARLPSTPGMGGAPMMGAGPLAQAARSGTGSGHTAASFLHTSDQGGEIVGDLGNVAPPVIGAIDAHRSADVELRI